MSKIFLPLLDDSADCMANSLHRFPPENISIIMIITNEAYYVFWSCRMHWYPVKMASWDSHLEAWKQWYCFCTWLIQEHILAR